MHNYVSKELPLSIRAEFVCKALHQLFKQAEAMCLCETWVGDVVVNHASDLMRIAGLSYRNPTEIQYELKNGPDEIRPDLARRLAIFEDCIKTAAVQLLVFAFPNDTVLNGDGEVENANDHVEEERHVLKESKEFPLDGIQKWESILAAIFTAEYVVLREDLTLAVRTPVGFALEGELKTVEVGKFTPAWKFGLSDKTQYLFVPVVLPGLAPETHAFPKMAERLRLSLDSFAEGKIHGKIQFSIKTFYEDFGANLSELFQGWLKGEQPDQV